MASTSNTSSTPSPSPPASLELESFELGQRRRGRPRLEDQEISQSVSDTEKKKIIHKRKYARQYREKIRADLKTKEELCQMLRSVVNENRSLRDTLEALRQENKQILDNLLALATPRLQPTPLLYPNVTDLQQKWNQSECAYPTYAPNYTCP
ncbi:hypothetical protein L596_007054 [Steinernema carpocapsae]|uniref:BZIP domain-containing protein n=1 Tax=Steinernema carpocapsae TaxID=34508 RepID=A0A4U5P8T2_STECR|nr:hypothetical protein L596_007054 [Steinernema carpocapsae]